MYRGTTRISTSPGTHPNVAGDVIQDEGDGDISAALVTYTADGDSSVIDLAKVAVNASAFTMTTECDDDVTQIVPCGDPHPGPRPPPPADTTFLTALITRDVCDNGLCGEGNEFEFRAHYKNSAGTTLYSQTLRIEGVPSSGVTFQNGGFIMIYRNAVGDGNYIDTDIVETDGFLNGDDNFDPNPVFTQLSDRNDIYVAGNFRLSCPPDYPRPCTELEMGFFWQ